LVHEHSAGGVVFRERDTQIDVLFIKDRYEHWTLPKGGLEAGETPEQAALREIREETGITGEMVSLLGSTRYWYTNPVGSSVHKVVDYFLVKAISGEIVPQDGEVLEVTWIPLEDANRIPGYANNRQVVSKAVEILRKGQA
jgi:diadenosine hexaphosphate hydrolase (ATP-forming)